MYLGELEMRMSVREESLIGLVEVPKKQAQVMLDAAYFYMELGKFKEAEEVFFGLRFPTAPK